MSVFQTETCAPHENSRVNIDVSLRHLFHIGLTWWASPPSLSVSLLLSLTLSLCAPCPVISKYSREHQLGQHPVLDHFYLSLNCCCRNHALVPLSCYIKYTCLCMWDGRGAEWPWVACVLLLVIKDARTMFPSTTFRPPTFWFKFPLNQDNLPGAGELFSGQHNHCVCQVQKCATG